jgi:hypothetical protein
VARLRPTQHRPPPTWCNFVLHNHNFVLRDTTLSYTPPAASYAAQVDPTHQQLRPTRHNLVLQDPTSSYTPSKAMTSSYTSPTSSYTLATEPDDVQLRPTRHRLRPTRHSRVLLTTDIALRVTTSSYIPSTSSYALQRRPTCHRLRPTRHVVLCISNLLLLGPTSSYAPFVSSYVARHRPNYHQLSPTWCNFVTHITDVAPRGPRPPTAAPMRDTMFASNDDGSRIRCVPDRMIAFGVIVLTTTSPARSFTRP